MRDPNGWLKKFLDMQERAYPRVLREPAWARALERSGFSRSWLVRPADAFPFTTIAEDHARFASGPFLPRPVAGLPWPEMQHARLARGLPDSVFMRGVTGLPGYMRGETLLAGRAAWLSGVTPLMASLQRQQQLLLALEQQDRDLERDAVAIINHFAKEGWHVFPLLWVDDVLLPRILRTKLDVGAQQAEDEVKQRMVHRREALKEYMRDRAANLPIPDHERERRLEAVFNQFDLLCEGRGRESVAGMMLSQAEGFFNAVTVPLGMEKGAFYTNHPERIRRRTKTLQHLHDSLPSEPRYLMDRFDRRKLNQFNKARAEHIPMRDALQHGDGFDHWTLQAGLKAATFLMLTLEYLEALSAAHAQRGGTQA